MLEAVEVLFNHPGQLFMVELEEMVAEVLEQQTQQEAQLFKEFLELTLPVVAAAVLLTLAVLLLVPVVQAS